jgi:hypothetical protein
MAGVYHRRKSPTQTYRVAQRQIESGELWGRAPRYGIIPAVKAYDGPLPEGVEGIEFTTEVLPDPGCAPGLPTWRGPRPGVRVQDGWAKIQVAVTRVRYSEAEG